MYTLKQIPVSVEKKYLDGEGNYTMDQKNNGTVSHSAAANINAKHVALSSVCLYT